MPSTCNIRQKLCGSSSCQLSHVNIVNSGVNSSAQRPVASGEAYSPRRPPPLIRLMFVVNGMLFTRGRVVFVNMAVVVRFYSFRPGDKSPPHSRAPAAPTHTGAAFTGQSHIGRRLEAAAGVRARQRSGCALLAHPILSLASIRVARQRSIASRRVLHLAYVPRTQLSNLCLCLSLTLSAFPRSYSKTLNPGRSSLDPRSLAGVRGPGPGSRALAWDPHLPITNLQQRQIQQHKQEIKQKLDHQIPPWHDMSIVLVADEAAIDPRSSHGMQIRLSSA